MKFPFTYHSRKDHQLVCINLDDQYHIMNIEVWDELKQCWTTLSESSLTYDTYLSDFREELNSQQYYE